MENLAHRARPTTYKIFSMYGGPTEYMQVAVTLAAALIFQSQAVRTFPQARFDFQRLRDVIIVASSLSYLEPKTCPRPFHYDCRLDFLRLKMASQSSSMHHTPDPHTTLEMVGMCHELLGVS